MTETIPDLAPLVEEVWASTTLGMVWTVGELADEVRPDLHPPPDPADLERAIRGVCETMIAVGKPLRRLGNGRYRRTR